MDSSWWVYDDRFLYGIPRMEISGGKHKCPGQWLSGTHRVDNICRHELRMDRIGGEVRRRPLGIEAVVRLGSPYKLLNLPERNLLHEFVSQ